MTDSRSFGTVRPLYMGGDGYLQEVINVGIDITADPDEHSIPLRVNGVDVMKTLDALQDTVGELEKVAPIKRDDPLVYSGGTYHRTILNHTELK